MSTTVVATRKGAKALLSGRVPNGQFDFFLVDRQVFHFKVDPDCRLNMFIECIVREPEQHTRLYQRNSHKESV